MVDERVDKMKMYLDIYYAINFIINIQYNKASKENMFNLLKKTQQRLQL